MDSTAELDAMRNVASALDSLSDDERARIIVWISSRYGVALGRAAGTTTLALGSTKLVAVPHVGELQTFAEFFDAADPQTESAKALVVGYWLQKRQGMATFDSATANRELKQLGHAVKNITAAFDDLREVKPALAVQTSKSGKSQQARKKYMITGAGEKVVIEMIATSSDGTVNVPNQP